MNSNARSHIIDLRMKNPKITQTEMAREIGCSRERVRQILNDLNYVLVPNNSEKNTVVQYCSNCNVMVYVKKSKSNKKYIFCNNECENIYKYQDLNCVECKNLYIIPRNIYNTRLRRGYKLNFCSKECQGRYLGKNHGRGVQTLKKKEEVEVNGTREK